MHLALCRSMNQQVEPWLKVQGVPAAVVPAVTDIIEITDAFCAEHLDDEYAKLCRALAVKLGRRRPSPLPRGDRRIWAGGIVHTVGGVIPGSTQHVNQPGEESDRTARRRWGGYWGAAESTSC